MILKKILGWILKPWIRRKEKFFYDKMSKCQETLRDPNINYALQLDCRKLQGHYARQLLNLDKIKIILKINTGYRLEYIPNPNGAEPR